MRQTERRACREHTEQNQLELGKAGASRPLTLGSSGGHGGLRRGDAALSDLAQGARDGSEGRESGGGYHESGGGQRRGGSCREGAEVRGR